MTNRNDDAFGYNARSELISAFFGALNYGYMYDAIGNRVWSAMNTLTNSYTANCLNQYSNIVLQSYGLQPYSLSPSYDADGNMTRLGDWYHAWDGENRLVQSQPYGLASNGAIRLKYQYNHRNLRIAKITERLSGRGAGYPFDPSQPGTWDAIETRRYVWDGYNIAAEIVINEVAPSANVTYYVWGTDLSGTLQGAGGVGRASVLAVNSSGGSKRGVRRLGVFGICAVKAFLRGQLERIGEVVSLYPAHPRQGSGGVNRLAPQ